MYLMIRNKGVADAAAFTMLGVSTTRNATTPGTIGFFGSGSKYSLALLLRNNINPVFICGNLRMNFYSKPKMISGQQFDQICLKYSGKDLEGNTKNYTEDLNITLQWGVADWTKVGMAFREFVSNAIDGATLSGGSHKDVEIEVVEKPRAKAGYTSVFLPLNEQIQECWKNLGTMFLHFSHPECLGKKLLPKFNTEKKTLIYKNGVLASHVDEESVFNYNLSSELPLDESRNASLWDVRYACSHAVADAEVGDLAKIIMAQIDGKNVFESKLDANYVYNNYETSEQRKVKSEKFKTAFTALCGENAVLCSGKGNTAEFVSKKGFNPVVISGNWFTTLEKYGISTETTVLSGLEKDGFEVNEPTPDMLKAVDMVWEMLEKHELLNGREKPPVKGFTTVMSGEAQLMGQYKDGVVYLHNDIGNLSPLLMKVALEEVVHFCTLSIDGSRDLQDFLFRLITKICF